MKKILWFFVMIWLLGVASAHAASFTQQAFELVSHRALAGDTSYIGTALNVRGYLYGYVSIFDAPVEANDPTSAVIYEVQTITTTTDGFNGWNTWARRETNVDTPATEAITATANANIFSVASVSGFAVGNYLYAQSTTTIGSGDWDMIQNVAAPYITIDNDVNYPKTTSDVLREPDVFTPIYVDLGSAVQIRVKIYNQMATDNDHHVWVKFIAVKTIE